MQFALTLAGPHKEIGVRLQISVSWKSDPNPGASKHPALSTPATPTSRPDHAVLAVHPSTISAPAGQPHGGSRSTPAGSCPGFSSGPRVRRPTRLTGA